MPYDGVQIVRKNRLIRVFGNNIMNYVFYSVMVVTGCVIIAVVFKYAYGWCMKKIKMRKEQKYGRINA